MAQLLRFARRPLATRSLAPTTALYRPAGRASFQSVSTVATGSTRDDDAAPVNTPRKKQLTRDQRLALLPPTLQAFHARHGHFVMYFGYKITEKDDSEVHPDLLPYPDAARGLRLGSTLHGLQANAKTQAKHVDTIQALADIGFPVDVGREQYVWSTSGSRRFAWTTAGYHEPTGRSRPIKCFMVFEELTHTQRLALLAPTLKVFQAKYGHFFMPISFVVPENLGADGKHTDLEEDDTDEAWPLRAPEQHVFECVPLAAFRVYRELHGNCLVPLSFVVPTGDKCWPLVTWGFKLGQYTRSFRHERHRFPSQDQLDPLDELGLLWKLNHLPLDKRLPLLAPTLKAFHARHGHFIMLANATVPKDDDSDANPHVPPYPTEARGAKLGTTLHRLHVRDQSRQKHSDVPQELAEIGFPVDVDWRDYVFEHQRLLALRVYVELFGDCVVSQWFIVPTGDAKWPKETWGLKLGEYVTNVRRRDYRSRSSSNWTRWVFGGADTVRGVRQKRCRWWRPSRNPRASDARVLHSAISIRSTGMKAREKHG